MTVLSAVQQAAPWIGIAVPSILFSATDRTSVEMQATVNEAAKAIADDYDWQRLKRLNTITGDGAKEDWTLPTDYGRMVKKASLWPSDQPNSPLVHVLSEDDWLRDEVSAFNSVSGRWIVYGGQLHIKPAIPAASTVKHFYVSKHIVVATGGTTPTKVEFDADDDEFFLPERLLKLAIIWRWKAAKGRPYAEDMENYNTALGVLATADKGSRVLYVGRPRIPADVTIAYPGTIVP